MKCQGCGNENKDKAKFCFKCGAKLIDMAMPKNNPQEDINATTIVKSEVMPSKEDLSTAPLSRAWLFFSESGIEMPIPYKAEVLIGRLDTPSRNIPDLDLTEVDKGKVTSRKHGCILYSQGKYKLQDMGSMNGTFINGIRLEANMAYDLNNGDEIVLGKLACTFSCLE